MRSGEAIATSPDTGAAGPSFKAFWLKTIPILITKDPVKPTINNYGSNSIYLVPNHKTSVTTSKTEL